MRLCTYVSKFVSNYSDSTAALRKLLKKNQRFAWNSQCQDEFENLKEHLTEKVTLKFYDVSKSLELHIDAYENSIGAVLLQRDENDINRPIAIYFTNIIRSRKRL